MTSHSLPHANTALRNSDSWTTGAAHTLQLCDLAYGTQGPGRAGTHEIAESKAETTGIPVRLIQDPRRQSNE